MYIIYLLIGLLNVIIGVWSVFQGTPIWNVLVWSLAAIMWFGAAYYRYKSRVST